MKQDALNYCQARIPGLTDRMVKRLREKLKTQWESQKGTRADASIQMQHSPTYVPLFKEMNDDES